MIARNAPGGWLGSTMSDTTKARTANPEGSPALQVRRDPMPMFPITVDESLSFTHPLISAAFAYWQICCHGRKMPERADLRPSDMRNYIAHVAFVDVPASSGQDYFVRVAGSKIEEVFGKRSARHLLDGVPKELHSHWLRPFEMVRTASRPLRGNGSVTYRSQHWLNAEILYAPLGKDGSVSTVFFVLATTRVSA